MQNTGADKKRNTGNKLVKDITGQTFGRLTVTSLSEKRDDSGGAIWNCRCECGNTKQVRGNSLKRGLVKSCGCLSTLKDLTGQTFGNLTVTTKTDKRASNGGVIWNCLCVCGNTREVSGGNLRRGAVRSCGCLKSPEDLSGQVFGNLKVIKLVEERGAFGKIIFECVCACGNTTQAKADSLKRGLVKSCGCLKYKHNSQINEFAKAMLVEGTSLSQIASEKLSINNTSGTTGVKWDKNRKKWYAQIDFQGKRTHLGSFVNKEDAIQARKEAEEEYYKPFLEKHKHKHKHKHKIKGNDAI